MSVHTAMLARPAVARGAQIVTGALLVWAALSKLGDIPGLARDVHNFRVLPVALENLLAIVLPWVELVTALALVLGIRARAAAIVATGLLLVLTAAVALAMARGLDIECGCFGGAGAMRVGPVKLLENAVLLAIAMTGTLRLPAGRDILP